jgi:hypothetical protein
VKLTSQGERRFRFFAFRSHARKIEKGSGVILSTGDPVDSQNLVHAGINANSGATGVLGWSSSSGGFGGLTQLDRSNWSADGLTKAGTAIGWSERLSPQ